MKRQYQLNYSDLSQAESMFDLKKRINKSNKTLSVLIDYLGDTSKLKLLDIGCSTGIITNQYADHFKEVTGIDIDKKAVEYAVKNYQKKNLNFINKPIEESNLKLSEFDVITCSHIYEHVPSDEKLIENIYKLLKPGGICYFAAGNRFKIIESHYRLPFLSFFPKKIANKYIKIFTQHDEYYENLKSLRNLKKLVKRFEINDYTLKILKQPSKFNINEFLIEKTFKYYFINFLAKPLYLFIPTYIWILKKAKN